MANDIGMPLRRIGSFSRWSRAKTAGERFLTVIFIVLRAIYCFFQIILFFLAYFGFIVPVLWGKKLWPRLYWFLEGQMYKCLQAFVAYWGYTAGYSVCEYGDDIKKYGEKDRVLVICNHQSTADVPTLFAAFNNKGVVLRKTLWVMSSQFLYTPFGIVGRCHGDHFIKQGKNLRDQQLVELRKQLQKVFWNRDRRWVILFPEGGFFYKRKETDLSYARKNGFPELTYCTLPRIGGFQTILEEVGPKKNAQNGTILKSSASAFENFKEFIAGIREKKYVKDGRPPINHVIDVTIAYPHFEPLSLATMIFGTREDCDIAVHYRVFDVDDVPFRDELALRDWMYDLYVNKDRLLKNYYESGSFEPTQSDVGRRIVFPRKLIWGQHLCWILGLILQFFIYRWLFLNLVATFSSFFAY